MSLPAESEDTRVATQTSDNLTPPPPSDDGSTTTEEVVIEWHTLHRDPILDVVIVSNDGVYFRASSYALKRASSFFKEMLSSMPNPYQTENDAIPLDYSAAAIAIFLDAYATPTYPGLTKLWFPLLHEHQKLINYLDCYRFVQYVRKRDAAASAARPVDWLTAASHDNDLVNGKAALVQCRSSEALLLSSNYLIIIGNLASSWRLPVLTSLFGDAGDSSTQLTLQWPSDTKLEALMKDLGDAERERKDCDGSSDSE